MKKNTFIKLILPAIFFISANSCMAANTATSKQTSPPIPSVSASQNQNFPNVLMQGKDVTKTQPQTLNKIGPQLKAAVYKKPLTCADLSIKDLSNEMSDELNIEQEDILSDLRILWQAAASKSETIRFAIYKLSNPDGKNADKSIVKKMLSPIAGVAPIVGMTAANPFALGSSIMSSGLLNSYLEDGSRLNERLSKVSDADMIILIKEIDDLQRTLMEDYYKYVSSTKLNMMADEMVKKRYDYYLKTQNLKNENVSIADAFYHEALDIQAKSRQDYLASRSALEQLVGNEALLEIEDKLQKRLATG